MNGQFRVAVLVLAWIVTWSGDHHESQEEMQTAANGGEGQHLGCELSTTGLLTLTKKVFLVYIANKSNACVHVLY